MITPLQLRRRPFTYSENVLGDEKLAVRLVCSMATKSVGYNAPGRSSLRSLCVLDVRARGVDFTTTVRAGAHLCQTK